ncbi:MAG TPA: rhodanese-like domain-containing protein, partial [Chryseolinea sp.]|nr:rhodanese-like domain-containing protein [Chryseolinea sp.]
LNQGHLKGAINLEIEAIRNNMDTIRHYKDKTIVFYCSHSQRSRGISRLLSENGFTKFYNLNGGMSVLNQLEPKDFPCKENWIETTLPFKNLSFAEAAALLKQNKKYIVIDIRPSSQFNSKDSIAENNIGRIKGAINIPYAEFKHRMSELTKYKQQPILVYSSSGDGDAARAATELHNSGFTSVHQLLGGIHSLIASQKEISFIENSTPFILVDAPRTLALLKETKDLVIYDTRVSEQYNNALTGRDSYRNLGRMKNAIHVEEAAFKAQSLPVNKNASILIYGNEESIHFASFLSSKGYKQVYLLPGLYDFVWSSFNVESCKGAREFLMDHEGLY